MMSLKFLPTAAHPTLPSIPLKRQKAVGELDFVVVLGRNRLDIRHVQNRIVVDF